MLLCGFTHCTNIYGYSMLATMLGLEHNGSYTDKVPALLEHTRRLFSSNPEKGHLRTKKLFLSWESKEICQHRPLCGVHLFTKSRLLLGKGGLDFYIWTHRLSQHYCLLYKSRNLQNKSLGYVSELNSSTALNSSNIPTR